MANLDLAYNLRERTLYSYNLRERTLYFVSRRDNIKLDVEIKE